MPGSASRAPRSALAAALLLLVQAAALAPAPAGAGVLGFVEAERHVPGTDGLDGASAVAASADGVFLYVAGSGDDAVTVLKRSEMTLAYAFLERKRQGENGVDGLEDARTVALTPDGNHVYVGGKDSIAIFFRHWSTGVLYYLDVVRDGVNGVDGLGYVTKVTVSPDGKHVYATALSDDSVVAFVRNASTGALTPVDLEKDGVGGVDGLDYAVDVIVSPDGSNVYVASSSEDSIAAFTRNAVDGTLTYTGLVTDGVGGVDGLAGVSDLAISPNGGQVYAAGYADEAIAIFSRIGGALFFLQTETDMGGVGRRPVGVDVSSDGQHVYVATSEFVGQSALLAYQRFPTFGTLSLIEVEEDGDPNVRLDMPQDVAVVGTRVVVPDLGQDAVALFSRNATTGAIAPFQRVVDAPGLDGMERLAMSPDGRSLYAALISDDAVSWLTRDIATGELTFGGVLQDGAPGVDGLDGAVDVAVSPNGAHVYVAAAVDKAISGFVRDPGTGALAPMQVLRDGVGGVDGIDFASGVDVSPDGLHVYVAGAFDSSVAIFSRAVNGLLTYLGRVKDGVGGVDGLYDAKAVRVSPDGAHVYALGSFDDAVAIFARSASTGLLGFVGLVKDGVGGVDGIDSPEALAFSPDGLSLYVTGLTDDAVAVFQRDPATGALAFVEQQKDGVGSVDGLDGPSDVRVSPDGKLVFVAGRYENAVAVFARNTATGALAFLEVARDGVGGMDGLGGVSALALAPDGAQLHAGASGDKSATVLAVTPPVTADLDADGVPDAGDNCPGVANPDQSDLGGLGTGSAPDGVGDACQCGDVNGDGRVTLADAATLQRSQLQPPTASMTRPALCDVNGSGSCSLADAVVLRRALLSPPTATISCTVAGMP